MSDSYTVSPLPLADYDTVWQRTRKHLPWNCIFVIPFWVHCVLDHLGAIGDPMILAMEQNGQLVGIVPLCRQGDRAFFIGHPDVCDYQDMIIAPGHEGAAGRPLLDYLSKEGIRQMDLRTLRPDAAMVRVLDSVEHKLDVDLRWAADNVTFETALPRDWDDYLMQLNGKQRHEMRRKIRRLEASGSHRFRLAEYKEGLADATTEFLTLFQLNRKEKADFMDRAMTGYFRRLMDQLAQQQMLRLFFLDVDEQPAATLLCFDYNGTRYLYNSGYDADYREVSVGILSKLFSIRQAIEVGCQKYDFLKGSEAYKKRMGGQEVTLSRCQVTF